MSVLKVDFFSKSLRRITSFHMILPNDGDSNMTENNENYKRDMKTLFLLHGFSGSSMDWMLGSNIQDLALKYNMAVIMPSGENSFYLDGKGTGRSYGTYTGEELVAYVRKTFGIAQKKEDTFIGGLSMGGFGAIHTGLLYNENFGKVFGLSSALIIHNIKNIPKDFVDGIADYDYYTATFGDLSNLEENENNPEYLVSNMKKEGKCIPSIYMACGTEDFLLRENRQFHESLIKENVEVTYVESSGVHDWKFWNEYLEPAIQWLLGKQ